MVLFECVCFYSIQPVGSFRSSSNSEHIQQWRTWLGNGNWRSVILTLKNFSSADRSPQKFSILIMAKVPARNGDFNSQIHDKFSLKNHILENLETRPDQVGWILRKLMTSTTVDTEYKLNEDKSTFTKVRGALNRNDATKHTFSAR